MLRCVTIGALDSEAFGTLYDAVLGPVGEERNIADSVFEAIAVQDHSGAINAGDSHGLC